LIGIGDLAAILAVVSVGIYVLGLMGLAVTIRLRLVDNISVAWYAVSLLPRTVVAGHGVRIWLTWPIGLTFVLGITTFLRGIADARGVPVDEDLFLLVLFIVGLLITLISFLRIRKAGGPRFAAHYDPFLVVGVTLISAWIGIFMMSIAVQVIGEVVIDAQPAPRPIAKRSQE
jgi:hypothetical protein